MTGFCWRYGNGLDVVAQIRHQSCQRQQLARRIDCADLQLIDKWTVGSRRVSFQDDWRVIYERIVIVRSTLWRSYRLPWNSTTKCLLQFANKSASALRGSQVVTRVWYGERHVEGVKTVSSCHRDILDVAPNGRKEFTNLYDVAWFVLCRVGESVPVAPIAFR